MKFLAALSLKIRLLTVICFLGGLPLVGAGLTYLTLTGCESLMSV